MEAYEGDEEGALGVGAWKSALAVEVVEDTFHYPVE